MTLPITINGRFLTRTSTGVDRFAFELLAAWWPKYGKRRNASVAISHSSNGESSEYVKSLGLGLSAKIEGKLQGHAWEQLKLPALSRDTVLLNLCNSGPVRHPRQIIVMHDTAVFSTPASYSFAYRTWQQLLMGRLVRGSSVIATVSKFSASELKRHFSSMTREVEVIYHGGGSRDC